MKGVFLGYSIRKILLTKIGLLDQLKDTYSNKRVILGYLLLELYRNMGDENTIKIRL